ncbi:MAG: hypothetical protein FJW83_01995 [Actinobacteria bacterium]|nr:hypothetical protein [Actinomycetota bacterium]
MLRRPFLAVATALVVGLAGLPAAAQSLEDARAQREANRAQQAQLAAELDLLNAEAAEIGEALEAVEAALRDTQAELANANAALFAAQVELDDRRRALEATASEIATTEERISRAVVDAYIGGLGGDNQWFSASDAREATQRSQLLGAVRGRFGDDMEQLRGLRQKQLRDREAAERKRIEAEDLQQRVAAAEAQLAAQRDTQARLVDALRSRIGDVEARKAELEAAEAELSSVINQFLSSRYGRGGTPPLTSESASGFGWPHNGSISSYFGWRMHPVLGYERLHAGIDLAGDSGDPIGAAKGGEVIFSGWNGGYGYCVIIAHDGGVSSLYAHLLETTVGVGERVRRGDLIGYLGSTGLSTGPHLHFEIRVGGTPVDPLNFL